MPFNLSDLLIEARSGMKPTPFSSTARFTQHTANDNKDSSNITSVSSTGSPFGTASAKKPLHDLSKPNLERFQLPPKGFPSIPAKNIGPSSTFDAQSTPVTESKSSHPTRALEKNGVTPFITSYNGSSLQGALGGRLPSTISSAPSSSAVQHGEQATTIPQSMTSNLRVVTSQSGNADNVDLVLPQYQAPHMDQAPFLIQQQYQRQETQQPNQLSGPQMSKGDAMDTYPSLSINAPPTVLNTAQSLQDNVLTVPMNPPNVHVEDWPDIEMSDVDANINVPSPYKAPNYPRRMESRTQKYTQPGHMNTSLNRVCAAIRATPGTQNPKQILNAISSAAQALGTKLNPLERTKIQRAQRNARPTRRSLDYKIDKDIKLVHESETFRIVQGEDEVEEEYDVIDHLPLEDLDIDIDQPPAHRLDSYWHNLTTMHIPRTRKQKSCAKKVLREMLAYGFHVLQHYPSTSISKHWPKAKLREQLTAFSRALKRYMTRLFDLVDRADDVHAWNARQAQCIAALRSLSYGTPNVELFESIVAALAPASDAARDLRYRQKEGEDRVLDAGGLGFFKNMLVWLYELPASVITDALGLAKDIVWRVKNIWALLSTRYGECPEWLGWL